MKNIIKHFLIFTLLIIIFAGCVETIKVKDDGTTSKLVVYCRLCPQLDTTSIVLTNSRALFSQTNNKIRTIDDGVVELSEDSIHWVRTAFNQNNHRYYLTKEEFPIVEGKKYYIRASHQGYDDVFSSCIVPVTHDVGFEFKTVFTEGDYHWGENYNWEHYDVYVKWNDVPNEKNFYSLCSIDDSSTWFYGKYRREWLLSISDFNTEYVYVSDKDNDGKEMEYLFAIDLENSDFNYTNKQFYLMFLDENCYNYEVTLSNDDEFSFFLLEPNSTFSNIENGFGLFGAFSLMKISNN